MIVVVATLAGILSVKLVGGRLLRLAQLEIRHLWLIWTTIGVQTLLFEVLGSSISDGAYAVVHVATYCGAFAFLWLNRHVPGALVIAVGAACNAIPIALNGGVMPASPDAWRRAGLPAVPPDEFENSNVVDSAVLAFLGDVLAIPAGWPLANVFSVGDVIIVLGGTYLAHRVCVVRHSPTPPTPGETALPSEAVHGAA